MFDSVEVCFEDAPHRAAIPSPRRRSQTPRRHGGDEARWYDPGMSMRILIALAGLLLLLAACGPANDADSDASPSSAATATAADSADSADSRASVEVQGDPMVGPATVLVYVLEDGEGVSGAEIEVTGDMTHAGMMPVIAEAVEAEPGLYRTEDFRFTMGGDWILTAEITLPDGASATTRTTLTVPAD